MSDVNANIGIVFDTTEALASLRQLQAGLSKFNQSLTQGNIAATNAQKGLNDQLIQAINSTGKFVASQKTVSTSTSAFTTALEKNQLSMREYFRYTAAAATANTKVLNNAFTAERDIINRARRDRVKALQSQYIQLTNANGELVKVLQVVPKHLEMVNGKYADYATRVQMAAQRQQLLNKLITQGSNQLLNFGKNTQWAGRQLMVGITIPLTLLGSVATKTFRDMEMAVVKFQRVYGDMTTTNDATNKAVEDIKRLGMEFTKYGIAVKDTVEMAASAAAMGLTGNALNQQIIAATRLAVLGQVSQQDALQTTISLQNAFGISSDQLAQKINFLNAVENQTVLSIEDLTTAIPKAAPVVKQLGGSVEDLAFFLTAMKEGGINASEGANALKSGLSALINPSKKASDFLANLGVNINGIVKANAGDLKGTVVGFARALDTLAPLERSRAIEQLFGKFQFARLSTLFQNITKTGSQASRALQLAGASTEELAILSERELGKVENAVGVKFQKSIEQLKQQLVPVGKAFLQALTPIVNFFGKILERFNNFSDGTKKAFAIVLGVVGGLAPVALMTFGLLANGLANLIKFFAMLRGGMAKLNGQNNILGGGFDYLTQQEIENLAQSNALHLSHKTLIDTFNVEAGSVNALAAAYANAGSQARALAASSPGLFNAAPGAKGAVSGLKFAAGGVVPGTGNKDTVPAVLTPGEVVLTKQTVKDNPETVAALQNGSVRKYMAGTADNSRSGASYRGVHNLIMGRSGLDSGPLSQSQTVASSKDIASSLKEKFVDAGLGSDAFKGRMQTLIEGAMSETQTGLDRVVRFAKEAGVEITDANKDQIEYWRKEMLKAVEEAGKELISQVDLSRDQIKKKLKEMSPTGQQTSGLSNTFDLIDSHGSQGKSKTFAHTEKSEPVPYSQLTKMLDKNTTQGQGVDSIQKAVDYINSLPDTDPRKPKNPIKPKFTPVSGAGINGISQGLNKDLDLGRAKVENLVSELNNLDPVEKWGTSIENGGGKVKELTQEIIQFDTVFNKMLQDLSKTKQVLSDADLQNLRNQAMNDTSVDPRVRIALQKSSNNITGVRLSGVNKDQKQTIQDVIQSGEVKTDLKKPEDFIVPKSGSAIAGETTRSSRVGTFDKQVDAELTRAEQVAETASPSKRTKRLGKDIADGLALGLEEGKAGVKSQSSRLTEAALPTAAETQARLDKMDLTNKAFYDDINTPDMRDQRQILKSQDRQRRKLGAKRTVDSTISAISNATSKTSSNISITNNTTINQEQAKADAANLEAAKLEQIAAKARIEAAKWREIAARENGKNSYTADNADALEKQAQKAEEKAAQLRIQAAELEAAQIQTQANAVKSAKTSAKKAGGSRDSKKGSKSSTAVMDADKKSAKLSEQIVDSKERILTASEQEAIAQQDQANSTISSSQLSDAVEQNLKDSASTGDGINRAEKDRLASAEQIAQLENDIEAQKRKEKETGQAALAAQMQKPIIPSGSQTNNKMINPNTAMGYEAAYEEAMSYTRDKNGQIVFDPEKGPNGERRPTTLSMKQIAQKKRGMRREAVGQYSGKISGTLGTAAMVAGMAGAPPAVTGALGAGATIAQFAPMILSLSGPQGAVAGLAALAAGAYLLNKKLEGTAAAIAKFTRATTVSTSMLKQIGEQTGRVGASEVMNRRRGEGQLDLYTSARARQGIKESTAFLQGEAGKALQEAFKSNSTKNGQQVAAEQFSLQLAAAISDGTIAPELGSEIAYQMGINLRDSVAGIRINAELRKLIGPNGEDLAKDPLTVRVRIAQEAASLSTNLQKQMYSKDRSTVGGNSKLSMFGTFGLIGAASGSDKAAGLAVAGSSAIETAQAQADAMQMYYETQLKTLKNELLATTNKEKQLAIQDKITKMTADQEAGMARMNNLVAAQLAKQENIAAAIIDPTGSGKVQGQGAFNNSQTFLNDIARREDAFFDAQKADVKAKYKGTAQEATAQRVLNTGARADEDKSFKSKAEGRTFEAKVNFLMQSGQMQPDQIETMMKIFQGNLKSMDVALTVGMRTQGAAKMAELASLLSGVTKKKAQEIIVKMARKDPKEFDRIGNALKILQRSDGLEVDMSAYIDVVGMPGLEKLSKKLDELEKLPDPIKKEAFIDFANKNNMDITALIADWDYYSKMPDAVRKEALQTYTTMYETMMHFDSQEAYLQWAKEQAESKALGMGNKNGDLESKKAYWREYNRVTNLLTQVNGKPVDINSPEMKAVASLYANEDVHAIIGTIPEITSKTASGGASGGSGPNPLDFLDSLAMRIKNVRDGAFDATKPLKSMMAAFTSKQAQKDVSKMFTLFDGLQQRMIKLKVPKEFRDMIAGMSADDFKKFASLPKGKNMFTYQKDKNGKELPRTKANIAGLTKEGEAVMQTYREAVIGEFNVAQKEVLETTKNQDTAFKMLIASGMSTSDALKTVEDSAVAAGIASGAAGKKGSAEMQQFIADTQAASDATSRLNALTKARKSNSDFAISKNAPALAKSMKEAGYSADQINEALSDPDIAKYLIEDLKDGKIEAGDIKDYIDSIAEKKSIDIRVKLAMGDFAGAAEEGRQLVDEMFSVQEALIKTGPLGQKLDANNAKIADYQAELLPFQKQIADINQSIADAQRSIEIAYTRPIEALQTQVESLDRQLETSPIFGNRAMQAIQDQNTIYSNDLAVISHQADAVNKSYDEQVKNLNAVKAVNDQIIAQQGRQLGLADALTQGDIAAAAKAAQEMRQANADQYATSQMDALEQSRQNALGRLKGPQSGLTEIQIQEQQYQNAQKLYAMENDPARLKIVSDIRAKQDEIYNLQQLQNAELAKIKTKEDEVYNIENTKIRPIQTNIDALTYENSILQAQIDKQNASLTVMGQTRGEWDKTFATIDASALASKDLDTAFGALLASTTAINGMWASILSKIQQYAAGVPTSVTAQQKSFTSSVPKTDAEIAKEKADAEAKAKADAIAAMDKALQGKEGRDAAGSSSLGFYNSLGSDGEKGNTAAGNIAADAKTLANQTAQGYANKIAAMDRAMRGKDGYLSSGGFVPKYFAVGGYARGTDTVPAMLTPGEFVMSKYAVDNYGTGTMKAMNNGSQQLGSVYNYELTVNVKSDANANDIANTVMTKIKQVDSMRLRGNKL